MNQPRPNQPNGAAGRQLILPTANHERYLLLQTAKLRDKINYIKRQMHQLQNQASNSEREAQYARAKSNALYDMLVSISAWLYSGLEALVKEPQVSKRYEIRQRITNALDAKFQELNKMAESGRESQVANSMARK